MPISRVKRIYFHKSNWHVCYLSDRPPSIMEAFCPSLMAEPFPRLFARVSACWKGATPRIYLVGPRVEKGVYPSFFSLTCVPTRFVVYLIIPSSLHRTLVGIDILVTLHPTLSLTIYIVCRSCTQIYSFSGLPPSFQLGAALSSLNSG